MIKRILVPAIMALVMLALVVSSAFATSTSPAAGSQSDAVLVAGNYCISCHMADDTRLATVTAWSGGIGREVNNPCPAATQIHEQLYYTERMLLMIDRAQATAGNLADKAAAQLAGNAQAYSRQLDEPVSSLEAFIAEAQAIRYRLNKTYASLNDMAEAAKRRTVLVYAVIATLIVLGSLAWGMFNTRAIRSASSRQPGSFIGAGFFLLAVLAFFALPILRIPAAEVAAATTEQQEAQGILDTADRAATTADRSQARAWMLARVGAAWSDSDPAQAQALLEEALVSVQQARENESALWGQSLAVQEASVGSPIDLEKAALIGVDLNGARARAWSLPLIAVEWNADSPEGAVSLLQTEQIALQAQTGIYRDLQMRSVALAWAQVDAAQAVPTAQQIKDAATRSWTLRELARLTGDKSALAGAAEAARQIEDAVQRSRALRELSLFDEAEAALEGVTGASLAYALSDLAAASGDSGLMEDIDETYPEARTAALLRMENYEAAWQAAAGIADPYEQARAQASIAGAWANAEAALQIQVPLYRDRALRDVIQKTGNVSLTESISSAYYKVQALTIAGEYQAALQSAEGMTEVYPLVELAVALAKTDPESALGLVEMMSREADKAVALRAVAAATGDPSLFERAQGMALAARVRGDALAPAQASLELADALWTVNSVNAEAALRQAYEAAGRISTK